MSTDGDVPDFVRRVDLDALERSSHDVRFVQSLLDRDSGGASVSVSLVRTPPGGGSPAGRHAHDVDQYYYVVRGTMHVEVDGRVATAGPGSLVVFNARIPHRNWNEGPEPTVHLAIHSPLPDPDLPFARPVEDA